MTPNKQACYICKEIKKNGWTARHTINHEKRIVSGVSE